MARIRGTGTWGASAVSRERRIVSEIEGSCRTKGGEVRSACCILPDARACGHSGTGTRGHFGGCGEGGDGGNEWRGDLIDVKASLVRRWLWCGIHWAECAVESVEAPVSKRGDSATS